MVQIARRKLDIAQADFAGRAVVVFFFKQKTAYEIVSRDWSSDVCSSDLNCCSLLLDGVLNIDMP